MRGTAGEKQAQEVDWSAKWIWASSHRQTRNFYLYARREFEASDFSSVSVAVTCWTDYVLYINGRLIGRGPSPCHPAFQYYDSYDVTHAVRPGKNVIGAVCYNHGAGAHNRPKGPGGFLLQTDVFKGKRVKESICTDDVWKVKPALDWDFNAPQMFWTTGFQEIYDSRKKPFAWNVVGFDDSQWQTPEIIGPVGTEPWTQLVKRDIPPLEDHEVFPEAVLASGVVSRAESRDLDAASRIYQEELQPKKGAVKRADAILSTSARSAQVAPGQDAFVVIDFGREVVGFPVIRITDGSGGTIDIGYSEALDAHGRVWPTRQNILQADRLILHGGRQEWQTFGRRAFRYVQLTFRDVESPLSVESVSLHQVNYPVKQVSSFECSDELLNKIWQTGVYTLKLCMQDQYEDCPLREHGQYPGDVRVDALENYYSFFDTRLVAKALWQFVQCQREDGFFNALWPSDTNHALPDYNLVWVMILHDYYLHTGDKALVEELYPNLHLLLEKWVRSQEGENGLLVYEPRTDGMLQEWWLFIDHADVDKRGEVAAYSAFYYQALLDASKLALALGHMDQAVAWRQRAQCVRDHFNDRFWNDELGVYADCRANGALSATISTQTNILAVVFGLVDSERRQRVVDYLLSDAPRVASSGPYFDFYVLQAYAMLGLPEQALSLIRSKWGAMLDGGATTWWETFDPSWDENAICPDSLCHGWSAAPTYFLPAEVLGVKPAGPESAVVVVKPMPGDLDWAKGRIKTHGGYVDVEWQRSESAFRIDIKCSQHAMVALPVGRFKNPQISEIDLSADTPEKRARRTYGWGNVIWRDGEEHDPYVDWLETQEAEPPDEYEERSRCLAEQSYIWVRESAYPHVRYEVAECPEG